MAETEALQEGQWVVWRMKMGLVLRSTIATGEWGRTATVRVLGGVDGGAVWERAKGLYLGREMEVDSGEPGVRVEEVRLINLRAVTVVNLK